jgi:AraC-like DNA-binding protein
MKGTERKTGNAEQVSLHTPQGKDGLQLMQARFRTRSFARHSHEGFGIGVIEQGALGFSYRGENVVAPAGRINTVNPDEVHTGHSATEQGWTYRMFYCSAELLQQMAEDIAGRPVHLPFFTSGVIEDDQVAHLVRQTHVRLMDGQSPRLEQETLLLAMFAGLFVRHTYAPPAVIRAGNEQVRLRRVIDYLDAHHAEDLAVDTLAAIACLSPYHFIRVFSRQTGLTPHAWLMQLRVRKAAALLRRGVPIADAAVQTGFSDQSHLNRSFKRILGFTPGQLRNSVQDA